MRPTSIVGPLILVALGVLLLWINLSSGFTVLDALALHWPWILVIWGFIRLCELLYWQSRSRPLPLRGVSGGEWFFIVLLCVAGSGLYFSSMVLGDLSGLPFRFPQARIFGDTHGFSIAEQRLPMEKNGRILVENLRGEVIITGADTDAVVLTGTEQVKALSEEQARTLRESRKITMEQHDGMVVIRTNQESIPSDHEMRAMLRLQIPRQARVEARGRRVNYEVRQIQGSVDVQTDDGDAKLTDIDGEARIRIARSRNIRLLNVTGGAEVYSNRGDNLELDNVRGRVSATGSFNGNIQLRGIQGPVHIEDRRLDLRAEAVPGEVIANRGDLKASGITGPLRIASESKDVELDRFTGRLEMILEKRDARIRQTDPRLAPMDLQVRRGKVTMELPPSAVFRFDGRARRGEIRNELGTNNLREETQSGETRLVGGPEGAPLITVHAERIELESSAEAQTARNN